MRETLKKIHLYAGLLSFSAMAVWGVVGIVVMLESGPGQREAPLLAVRTLGQPLPDNLDDRAASEWIRREGGLAMVNPAVLRRSREQNLVCEFYGPNGMVRAEVLEPGRQVRLSQRKIGFTDFLNRAHAMSPRTRITEWPARAWAFYNEFALWSLFVMIVSGVWLWLGSRRDWKPAWVAFAAGTGAFAALWMRTI